MYKLFNIKQTLCTPFHPESNGSLERLHAFLKKYLRTNRDLEWDEALSLFTISYNVNEHSVTGYTSYELVFRKQFNILDQLNDTIDHTYGDYLDTLKKRLQNIHIVARNTVIQEKESSKGRFDKTAKTVKYNVGDKVWLKIEQRNELRDKLSSRYEGPYEILKLRRDHNVQIARGKRNEFFRVNRLKKHNFSVSES